MDEYEDSRVAFGMRDKLLVQCKDVIEVLKSELDEERVLQEQATSELSDARRKIALLESELAAKERSLEDSESEKTVLQTRIDELLEKTQALQNQCFLEIKKRNNNETKVLELAETLRQTQTRNEELANALILSQTSLKDTVFKVGNSDSQAFRELQARYDQVKESEQELIARMENLVQENDQLTNELLITKRKLELVLARDEENGHFRLTSAPVFDDSRSAGSVEEAYPVEDPVTGRLLPVPSSTPLVMHFDEELENQKREHEELLQRMKRLMKDFRPRPGDIGKHPE